MEVILRKFQEVAFFSGILTSSSNGNLKFGDIRKLLASSLSNNANGRF